MTKTLVPEDFAPDEGKLKLLTAWGKVNPPKGDQLLSDWFTTRVDVVAGFVDYWLNRAKDKKKKDWQATYCNYIKRIAWPNELRVFENNRHHRRDEGMTGFKRINEAYGSLIDVKPIERKYKIVNARPEVEAGPTNPLEALKAARRALNH